MTVFFFTLLLCVNTFAAGGEVRIFEFKGADSVELKGEASPEKLAKELAAFGLTPVLNRNSKGILSLGVIEYPMGPKRYREVWISALAHLGAGRTGQVYLYVVTDNPFPRWLNDSFRYKLPLDNDRIKYDLLSFQVRSLLASMDPLGRYESYPPFKSLRIEHQENKFVSALELYGDAFIKPWDPERDELRPSEYIRSLGFIPKLWVIREGTSGEVLAARWKGGQAND